MNDNLKNLSKHKEMLEKDIAALRREMTILEESGFPLL